MAKIRRDIIDNTAGSPAMSDILNSEIPHTKKLDVSTGYFDVRGYAMLKDALNEAAQRDGFGMRLLLGKQALIPDATFEEMAQKNGEDAVSLKSGLDEADLTLGTMSDTVSLIGLLKRKNIRVRLGNSRFNHSKCYITDESAFIGSSNFTAGGLTGNYELNAGLYQPGVSEKTGVWFDKMWEMSEDTKRELVGLLESSKFGVPATPYDVYIKMIFEKYRDMLTPDKEDPTVDIKLTAFQKTPYARRSS